MKKTLYYFAFCLSLASFVACSNTELVDDYSEQISCDANHVGAVTVDGYGYYMFCEAMFDTYGWVYRQDTILANTPRYPGNDGDIGTGVFDSSLQYVFDVDHWRVMSYYDQYLGRVCTRSMERVIVQSDSGDIACAECQSSAAEPYGCWRKAKISDYEAKDFLNDGVEYGTVTDTRDGNVYKTVEINGKTWMAENLRMYVAGECNSLNPSTLGCIYSWSRAMDYGREMSRSVDVDAGESVKLDLRGNKGVCMDGWHVPDTTEWKELFESYDTADFLSAKGWGYGTNGSGFSVAPIAYTLHTPFDTDITEFAYAFFATADYGAHEDLLIFSIPPRYNFFGYGALFDKGGARIRAVSQQAKGDPSYTAVALRCVKDYE